MAPTLAALAYREIDGITLYSGYPTISIEGNAVGVAGIPPYTTPVQFSGATVETYASIPCGEALCATVPGGAVLLFDPD